MIAHIDADAFFASVEQAIHPQYKGKPLVTGKERNIIAAASYEAKALGIKRGLPLWEAKRICPQLIVLPTDYETVSLFSRRMFEIMRRYTPTIEEYGVDEGFLDLTNLSPLHKKSYEQIARSIQTDIHRELNITVSVGLSVTKALAKTASKKQKPAGFTVIEKSGIKHALQDLPAEDIWNIGPATTALLRKHGINTAWQFSQKPFSYLENILTKPSLELWHELNGKSVWPVCPDSKTSYQSISKTRTFTPPSKDREYVLAQLAKNLENACIKARRYRQTAGKVIIFLKRNDYRAFGLETKLPRTSAFPLEIMPIIKKMFTAIYQDRTAYRATGVILTNLTESGAIQPSLFETFNNIKKTDHLYSAIDSLRKKYGKHTVHHAVSLPAQSSQHLASRGDTPQRKTMLLKGENSRQRLPVPLIHVKV